MTRKRFVKLLMSKGYDRNEAQELARVSILLGKSYEDAYNEYGYHWASFKNIDMEAVYAAMSQVAETAKRICNALTAGFAAFGEAYRSAME